MTVRDIKLQGLSGARAWRVLLLDTVDSTNAFLMRFRHEYGDGTAAITQNQTAGRGRGNHVWQCGGGLAMSALFKKKGYFSPLLPLAAAVAASRAAGELAGCSADIKWPNDILINGKKICGILCESMPAGDGYTAAVCGAGFNLAQPEEFFAAPGLVNASSVLAETGRNIAPLEMAAAFLNELGGAAAALPEDGALLLREYRRRCITVGKKVTLLPSGQTGLASGISDSGALIVETENGTVEAYGEVSVRAENGYA